MPLSNYQPRNKLLLTYGVKTAVSAKYQMLKHVDYFPRVLVLYVQSGRLPGVTLTAPCSEK
jgi:hypothetical protein